MKSTLSKRGPLVCMFFDASSTKLLGSAASIQIDDFTNKKEALSVYPIVSKMCLIPELL